MKKICSLAIASLLLVMLVTSPGLAQTAEDILQKMIEAKGGKKTIEVIKDMTLSGTIELVMQGLSGQFTIYKKEPDKRRVDFETTGMVFSRAYDGKTGWQTNPQTGGIEEMSGEQLESIKRESMPIVSLLDPQKYSIGFTYKGKEEIEGKEYFVLDQTYPGRFKATLNIDSKTYLSFKSKSKMTGPMGGEVEIEQFQSDFRKENRLLMAHSIITYANGEELQQINIEEVNINTDLEDSLFKMNK